MYDQCHKFPTLLRFFSVASCNDRELQTEIPLPCVFWIEGTN